MNKTEIRIIFALIMLTIIGTNVFTYVVMRDRQRVAVADEQKSDAKEQQKVADDTNANASQRITERDDALNTRMKARAKQTEKISASPEAAAAELSKSLPAPLEKQRTFESDQPVFTVPPDSVISLYKNQQQCANERDELATCKADKEDLGKARDQMFKAAMEWKKSSEQYEVAAKGGTKAQRFWSSTLKVGIGIAIGYGARVATHK